MIGFYWPLLLLTSSAEKMATISAVVVRSLQPLPSSSSSSPYLPPRNLAYNFKPLCPFYFSSNSEWMNQTRDLKSVRARASASGFAENLGDALGEVDIFTATGELVLFKDLWDQNEGIAVVALLRHFGCPCCWELASTLKEMKPRLDSAGVKLIAVGVGTPNKARILAERLPFPLDCLYADPERKAYDLLGLYYGLGRTFFNPASVKVFSRFDSLQKAVQNYTIEATPDDRSSVLQQGGMFVFKGKELLYAWKDEGTGDHAPLDDIFDACNKVTAS